MLHADSQFVQLTYVCKTFCLGMQTEKFYLDQEIFLVFLLNKEYLCLVSKILLNL